MVAITRSLAPAPTVGGRSARSSPELDANLRTARAQMADWVTCPSAKTPEGKAKIAQISTRLETIKHEIKQADGASPSASASALERAAPGRPSSPADPQVNYLGAPGPIGHNVDTYA